MTIRELVNGTASRLLGRSKSFLRGGYRAATTTNAKREDYFWALKDASFDVRPGEIIGIVGRNGAGKSTLLKILSKIATPTTGRVELRGRVASLLEVGTGFHPDLTGRENVYLNGAILGMTKSEIDRKFDDIIDFARIDRFTDVPVKRYSSGMYVRLAFAVAAHLDPDVLIVDEVLAVGDAAFQSKCLGLMNTLGNNGRSVIFVSHNLHQVARLTKRCVLLGNGTVEADGPTGAVIRQYLRSAAAETATSEWRRPKDVDRQSTAIRSITVRDSTGEITACVNANQLLRIQIEYEVQNACELQAAVRLNASDGTTVLTSGIGDSRKSKTNWHERGRHLSECIIPADLLRPGFYTVFVSLNGPGPTLPIDAVDGEISFQISPVGSLVELDSRWGAVAPVLTWTTDHIGS